jgi:hypothetical protein
MPPPDHNEAIWAQVPEHLKPGLMRYLDEHSKPGSFLRAVLENDLHEAVSRMEPPSFPDLKAVLSYLYNCAQGHAWGNPEKFDKWTARCKQCDNWKENMQDKVCWECSRAKWAQ